MGSLLTPVSLSLSLSLSTTPTHLHPLPLSKFAPPNNNRLHNHAVTIATGPRGFLFFRALLPPTEPHLPNSSPGPTAAAAEEEPEEQVQELRVPDSWLLPSNAQQESEWLRVALHKWLDDEYCPEPTNVEISKAAARSYCESLVAKRADLGDILLKMAGDLESSVSFRESFHGAFSSANAAIHLITSRLSSATED